MTDEMAWRPLVVTHMYGSRPATGDCALRAAQVVDAERYPQLVAVKNCFVRGSVVRYVQIPAGEVDTELLQDAARKENEKKKE
jgi:hypothetical protein